MRWNYNDEVCGNCQFWVMDYPYAEANWHDRSGMEPSGSRPNRAAECRKRPPCVAFRETNPQTYTAWPQTKSRDFCGEFKFRKAVDGQ